MPEPVDESLFSQEQVDDMVGFARAVGRGDDVKNEAFKAHVRSLLPLLNWTRLNIYWSRTTCGASNISLGKDVLHFTFNTVNVCASYRLATAVKCAQRSATCYKLLARVL